MTKCKHCGRKILFNRKTRKWVTSKSFWRCGTSPEKPVNAHEPVENFSLGPITDEESLAYFDRYIAGDR